MVSASCAQTIAAATAVVLLYLANASATGSEELTAVAFACASQWKSVYLLPVPPKSVALKQLVLHTFYAGAHPTSILSDDNHAGFELKARVVLWAPTATTGKLVVAIPDVDGASATVETSAPAGTSNVTVVIPASATKGVRLWHPRGNGDQFRYNVTATWEPVARLQSQTSGSDSVPAAVSSAPSTWRLLGFRHVALVTINDTDAAAVAAAKDQDGTGAWKQSCCDLLLPLRAVV